MRPITPFHIGQSSCLQLWAGIITVLHTWGSATTQHSHIHMIVPAGGLSPDGGRAHPACRHVSLAMKPKPKTP